MADPAGSDEDRALDEDETRDWEIARMVELGLPADDAIALADQGVSWHQVDELLARGCPALLAARVL